MAFQGFNKSYLYILLLLLRGLGFELRASHFIARQFHYVPFKKKLL
jgi:hypothetical protein